MILVGSMTGIANLVRHPDEKLLVRYASAMTRIFQDDNRRYYASNNKESFVNKAGPLLSRYQTVVK